MFWYYLILHIYLFICFYEKRTNKLQYFNNDFQNNPISDKFFKNTILIKKKSHIYVHLKYIPSLRFYILFVEKNIFLAWFSLGSN